MVRGSHFRLADSAPAATPVRMNIPTRPDCALKLNPHKPFDVTQSEYKTFIIHLNFILNSDPERYTGPNADNAKMPYTVSYLSELSKEWLQSHVNEITGIITLHMWARFIAALKAAFDNPDVYHTAYTKISSLKQECDCFSYHTAFVPLATILGFDVRTRIPFLRTDSIAN